MGCVKDQQSQTVGASFDPDTNMTHRPHYEKHWHGSFSKGTIKLNGGSPHLQTQSPWHPVQQQTS
jgi:hypothetical protein